MKPTTAIAAAVAVAAAALTLTASASEGRHGREREEDHGREGAGRSAAAAADPAYLKECGACHLAYPPAMLPAASWRSLMGGLDRHFGQNAELDEPARSRLEGWLTARAGGDGAAGAPARITELPWFRKEHRRAAAAAAGPQVRSMANCAACHPGAAQWDFEEDRVRIPRG